MQSRLVFLVAAMCVAVEGFAFEIVPQLGHSSTVEGVAYSPDGKYLATSSDDKTLKLWELSSGKEVRTIQSPTPLGAIAFSPDGKTLATSGGILCSTVDCNIRLWDFTSGKELRTLPHGRSAKTVSFSADGSAVFIPNGKRWEVSSGKELPSLSCVAVSPDGGACLVANADGTLRLLSFEGGKEIQSFKGHPMEVTLASFSADGKLIVSAGNDRALRLWEISSGKALRVMEHTTEIAVVVFSPDGATIASSGVSTGNKGDHRVRLWDTLTGNELRTMGGHSKEVNALAFSPDSKTLTSVSWDQSIRLWSVATGQPVASFGGYRQWMRALAYSSDGKHIAFSQGKTIRLWEVASGREVRAFEGHSKDILTLTFSPDGKTLASGGFDKAIILWDVSTGKALRSFRGLFESMDALAFSPDGKSIAYSSFKLPVGVLEVSSGRLLRAFIDNINFGVAIPSIKSLAFSPDGKRMAFSDGDKGLNTWEVSSGKAVVSFVGHTGTIDEVAFSPNGKILASLSWSSVKIWDAATGKELRSFAGSRSISFSPDGKYLATNNKDGAASIVEVSSGKESRVLPLCGGPLAFSPDGKYIACGDQDGLLRLWRADGKASVTMASRGDGEWLLYSSDGYFDSSTEGASMIAAVDGLHGYSIEQLALKYNRPDLLLKNMGLGSPALIDYYYKRYLQRLKKAKITDEKKLEGAFRDLPQSTITEVAVNGQQVEASLTLEDKVGLLSYQVYVNGVPHYEDIGKEISGPTLTRKETIALTEGVNRIEVSSLNTRGQESLRALSVVQGPAKTNKDLYFVGFGVSDYADDDIPDLSFAHKDAKELSEAFAVLKGYDNKYNKTYTNKQVTKESIREAKEFLKKARAQDTVVLFIAGHGMHDRDALATYYYIIHNTQITPNADGTVKIDTATAVSFTEIEGLLSGLESKQKLFLMDTCESGERDEVDVVKTIDGLASRGLNARAIGVAKVTASAKPKKVSIKKGTARPWLLERDRFIYQDLAKRTGAVVFSSAKGNEYAYEDPALENGLFTEALLDALSSKIADRDGDAILGLAELRAYVSQSVITLSEGRQHPTVDRNNRALRLSFIAGSRTPPTVIYAHNDKASSLAFSPNGKLVATSSADGTIKLWDVSIGKLVRSFTGHVGTVVCVAFSADGRYLVSGGTDFTTRLWDASNGKELRSLLYTDGKTTMENEIINEVIYSVSISPDGKYIASGRRNGTISIWETDTGKSFDSFMGSSGEEVDALRFSPDSKSLAYASFNDVLVHDLASGLALWKLKGHAKNVAAVAYSKDGTFVASASADGTVKLWGTTSGKLLRSFTGHNGRVFAVAFSPDGDYLISGGGDTTVRLWRIEDAKELRLFAGHKDVISSVAFSPDGDYAAAVSLDGSLRFWEAFPVVPRPAPLPLFVAPAPPVETKPVIVNPEPSTTPTVVTPPIVAQPETPKPIEDAVVIKLRKFETNLQLGASSMELDPEGADESRGVLLSLSNNFSRSKAVYQKNHRAVLDLRGLAGISNAGDLWLDGRGGLGYSLRAGEYVRFIPSFGFGADTLQAFGDEAGSVSVLFAPYRYFDLRFALKFNWKLSLEGAFSHSTRSTKDTLPDEMNRLELSLQRLRWSIILQRTFYYDTVQISSLGVAFEF